VTGFHIGGQGFAYLKEFTNFVSVGQPWYLAMGLGIGLIAVGVLILLIWKEKVSSLESDERKHFLLFDIAGGSWVIAVFAVCTGFYITCHSLL
jgi:hypothetical protein